MGHCGGQGSVLAIRLFLEDASIEVSEPGSPDPAVGVMPGSWRSGSGDSTSCGRDRCVSSVGNAIAGKSSHPVRRVLARAVLPRQDPGAPRCPGWRQWDASCPATVTVPPVLFSCWTGPVHAQMLGVDLGRLLPQRKTEDPGQISLAGISDLVAGTGFEPVASGL